MSDSRTASDGTPEIAISAKGLKKSYASPGQELEVLRGVDLDLAVGEIVSVVGLSGVGKSTLLNVLGLLDTPTAGTLEYRLTDGRRIDSTRFNEKQRARLRNEQIGFVFQFFHLLADLDVRENVLLPTMITRSPIRFRMERKQLIARADELLDRVGLADRSRHRPRQLSGGERQRVAVARALMNEPSVLLCDEPTGNLDTRTSDLIHDLFVEINREIGTTVLLVTHDPSLADRAHRKLEMVDGRFLDPESATSVSEAATASSE